MKGERPRALDAFDIVIAVANILLTHLLPVDRQGLFQNRNLMVRAFRAANVTRPSHVLHEVENRVPFLFGGLNAFIVHGLSH